MALMNNHGCRLKYSRNNKGKMKTRSNWNGFLERERSIEKPKKRHKNGRVNKRKIGEFIEEHIQNYHGYWSGIYIRFRIVF
jgi:hypothetical protein